MNDCPNADVRDLLPDLVHGHLDAESRRLAEVHVAGCADCRAELDLLRGMQSALRARTPALDIAAIAAAIPAHRQGAPARRSWVGWRTAAAITMIAAGGSSMLMLRHNVTNTLVAPVPVPVADAPEPPVPNVPATVLTPPRASTPAPQVTAGPATSAPVVQTPVAGRERELAMAGGTMTDLSDKELATLLKDIEKMDAMPTADVDAPSIAPISPRRPPQ